MEDIKEMYTSTVKREKRYRISQLVSCILLALMSIPLIKIGLYLSGIMVIIVGTVMYIKLRQLSLDRIKCWRKINDEMKKHEKIL